MNPIAWLLPALLVSLGFFGAPMVVRTTGLSELPTAVTRMSVCEEAAAKALAKTPEQAEKHRARYDQCADEVLGDPSWFEASTTDRHAMRTKAKAQHLSAELRIGPCCEITSKPGLGWRGDELRYLVVEARVTWPKWWPAGAPDSAHLHLADGSVTALETVETSRERSWRGGAYAPEDFGRSLAGAELQKLVLQFAGRRVEMPLSSLSNQQIAAVLAPEKVIRGVGADLQAGRTVKVPAGYRYSPPDRNTSFAPTVHVLWLEGDESYLIARWGYRGNGAVTLADGSKYSGGLEGGQQHGHGVLQKANGERYEGGFKKGIFHGRGLLVWKNGDRYDGDWVDGDRHGQGTFVWSSGDRYDGDWVNGRRTGQGEYIWSDGDRYQGQFVQGKLTGFGTKWYKSGHVYEGEYLDGDRHGFGVLKWANGSHYEGDWVKGERTGQGKYRSHKGWTYTGEFRDGQRHGAGRMEYADGRAYEGPFVNGDRHGVGTYTLASGRSTTREYDRGKWADRPVRKPKPKHPPGWDPRRGCGSYEKPCREGNQDSELEAFAKSLSRSAAAMNRQVQRNSMSAWDRHQADQAEREYAIKAEESRWRGIAAAEDRKLKAKLAADNAAYEARRAERAEKRRTYQEKHGTCDENLVLDKGKKAWYYLWSSRVCGINQCDNRSNKAVETRVFVSNLVYARGHDYDNLGGAYFDQVRIDYGSDGVPNGEQSNGYRCRGDARNARRSFIANRSSNERTRILNVNVPEYP